MRIFFPALVVCLFYINCQSVPDNHQHQQQGAKDTTAKKPLSPHTSTMAMVGDAHVHIDYSSPSVRGRVIWGGLVAYDKVWVSGAHNATSLETNKALVIDNNVLPAGKYALFTIPGKDNWTVIFNKNWDQHGADEYNGKEDVFRVTVKPEILPAIQEELLYEVKKESDKNGTISLSWEKIKITFPFAVKE
ncbi:MAG: DUF2911 domain-containing protein [Chitinophagaceae bacterium]|nr:DUF2911 domain-containing protein [Chitinophagaceae bacterium]